MSKRYGRNQRRRARERIAQLEERGERMRKVVATRDQRLAELREHLEYVGATLGHMSVLAGDTLHHMDGFDGMQLVPQKPLPDMAYLDHDEKLCVEIMRLLDVEAVRDMASRCIHAIVHVDGKKAAYAISESALRTMPTEALRHFLMRQVTPLLCATIVDLTGKKV